MKFVTDKPLPETYILSKSDLKENVKEIIGERDLDDIVKLHKDTKITTCDKTDSKESVTIETIEKTNTTDKVSKISTIESKTSGIIDHENVTDKPLPETSILSKSDSKENVKNIIGERDLDDIVKLHKDTKIPTSDKTKLDKTDFKDSVTIATIEKTNTTDEVYKISTIESKTSEIIDHEILTDKSFSQKTILSKSDTKENVKEIIGERDLDDIVKLHKDTKITTCDKTKLDKTDTTDEVSKISTIESKTSEIIDHEIITDKPFSENAVLIKPESRENVKAIISEKDFDEIVEHDKDTKIPTSDKTKHDKTDFKDSVTNATIEKTDTTNEISKISTIESKTSGIIDHENLTDKPLSQKAIPKKSDSKVNVKEIIGERDLDDIVKLHKDTKITTCDKTDSKDSVTIATIEKTDTTDEVSIISSIESKTSEIIDNEIVTDKPLPETSILSKSDSKENFKENVGERDLDDIVKLHKDSKMPTSEKTKLDKTDFKDSDKIAPIEKSDTTDEVSIISTIESKTSEIINNELVTDKPLPENAVLIKPESRENVKAIISEKDFDEIVEHDKYTNIPTSDKTKHNKTDFKDLVTNATIEITDTTNEISKISTIEYKTSEIIDHEILTDKSFSQKTILTKSDLKVNVKEIIGERDLDDIVKLHKDSKMPIFDKTKLDKTEFKDSDKIPPLEKTDTTDEVSIISTIESKTSEIIDHEIVTDKPLPETSILSKSDSKENVKEIIGERDLDDIVKLHKDSKMPIFDKTKLDKTDTTDEVSKISTIESKTSEIIDHEIVTDKPLSEYAVLIKPESRENVKAIISEKDFDEIVEHDKDTKIPTSDKTKHDKSDFKDSVTNATIEKTATTDEVSKITTIKSKPTEIIDHEIVTDKPLFQKAILTKSDSKENVKTIISERDLDDIVVHHKDTKIPYFDKTKPYKTDTTDELSTQPTIESNTSEVIDNEIATDTPLPKKSVSTKSDSKENVKTIISEKDIDDIVEHDKDTKIPTSDKTKHDKTDFKDLVTNATIEKTDTTDEVSIISTIESKTSEIIDHEIVTDKPLPDTSILSKSDSKENVKEIVGERDLDDIVVHHKDTKIPSFDKTKPHKTDTTDELSTLPTIESNTSEVIDNEIATDTPLPKKSVLTKSDSKENVKTIISEKDIDDIVEHDKDTKIPTSDKTKHDKTDFKDLVTNATIEKTDTSDEVSKITTIKSKPTEIIDHEIVTDKLLFQKAILTKSDSKENVKTIISEKDIDDIVEHDKDTKITTCDKTDSKDSVTIATIEKTDTTNEVSKISTIESKTSGIIDHENLTDKPLSQKAIPKKSDSKVNVKEIIGERDLDDIVEHDKDTKIPTSDKTDSKDSVTITTIEKTATTDEVSKITTIKSKPTEIIDHEIVTDKPLFQKAIPTKSDLKENVKEIIGERDLDDIVEHDKDTKIPTSDKTDSKDSVTITTIEKTATTDEVSKITTIKSKPTEIIDHEIVTDKPLFQKAILTKSDSKENVKTIISEKDIDDIVEHDKDTKIPTSDKTESKDSVKIATIEKTDTTDEVSKMTTIESKTSGIIDHEIVTDKPLSQKAIQTKSDSKENVKEIIDERDLDDIVKLHKDSKMPIFHKTKLDKTDTTDEVSKISTIESKTSEIIDHEIVTDKPLSEYAVLIKPESRENVKAIISEKDFDEIVEHDKDTKIPTSDKTKHDKSDFKDSVTNATIEKTATTDEVSKITTIKSKPTEIIDHEIVTDKPLFQKAIPTKSDLKENVKEIIGERDLDDIVKLHKDTKITTCDKTDSKDSVTIATIEKTDTTDEVSIISSIESKTSEIIDNEIVTDKPLPETSILSKSDSKENFKENIGERDLDDIVKLHKDTKITTCDKTDSKDSVTIATIEKTDTTDEVSIISSIESKTSEIIDNEIVTDKPLPETSILSKSDSKENFMENIGERDLDDIVKHHKDSKMPTSEKTKLDKTDLKDSDKIAPIEKSDTTDEVSKISTIESKTSEIIDHEIVTDKPLSQKAIPTKSDLKENVKEIIGERDLDDIEVHHKDTKIPSIDKTKPHKTDTTDELSKITTIESNTSEVIDNEIAIDTPLPKKSVLTKSASKENVKTIISEKDIDDIVEHDKDTKITTSDKTKVDKTDSKDSVTLTTIEKTATTDEVSKITTIKSKPTEIIDHEIVTDKPLFQKAILTKSDSGRKC
ncbi:hypothetical protein AGLY_003087 [Aphis glycines]|uniref:Uncharacterized protein n=1 Tax=Aphis glycines TaxID=307491 RepID=A0A6G0U4M7_APHGL|nr:hypothetical protein AGLY_003087 [Aphis glycines]